MDPTKKSTQTLRVTQGQIEQIKWSELLVLNKYKTDTLQAGTTRTDEQLGWSNGNACHKDECLISTKMGGWYAKRSWDESRKLKSMEKMGRSLVLNGYEVRQNRWKIRLVKLKTCITMMSATEMGAQTGRKQKIGSHGKAGKRSICNSVLTRSRKRWLDTTHSHKFF